MVALLFYLPRDGLRGMIAPRKRKSRGVAGRWPDRGLRIQGGRRWVQRVQRPKESLQKLRRYKEVEARDVVAVLTQGVKYSQPINCYRNQEEYNILWYIVFQPLEMEELRVEGRPCC
jgi:hypothetical protein